MDCKWIVHIVGTVMLNPEEIYLDPEISMVLHERMFFLSVLFIGTQKGN